MTINMDGPSDHTSVSDEPAQTIILADDPVMSQKASTAGFRESLVKDLRDMIIQAHKQAAASPDGRDFQTGLDKATLDRLVALYRKRHGQVFDQPLWSSMTDALLQEAANKPLPLADASELEYLRNARSFNLLKSNDLSQGCLIIDPQNHKNIATPIRSAAEGTHRDDFQDYAGSKWTRHQTGSYSPEPGNKSMLDEDLEHTGIRGATGGANYVPGGVAVTEEAMQTHSPEVIMAV